MYLKLFLVESEPLHSESAEGIASCPINSLRAFRQEFQKLLLDKMRAPDGSYEEGLIIPGTDVSPPRVERSSANLDQNNPLSLHDEVRSSQRNLFMVIFTQNTT